MSSAKSGNCRVRAPSNSDRRSAAILRSTCHAGPLFFVALTGLSLSILVQPLSSLLIETWKLLIARFHG